MECYRDIAFCPYYKECANPCSRALTDKVRDDAEKWWGKDPPICTYLEKPPCFKEKFKVPVEYKYQDKRRTKMFKCKLCKTEVKAEYLPYGWSKVHEEVVGVHDSDRVMFKYDYYLCSCCRGEINMLGEKK